jgi:hypothetical protein
MGTATAETAHDVSRSAGRRSLAGKVRRAEARQQRLDDAPALLHAIAAREQTVIASEGGVSKPLV